MTREGPRTFTAEEKALLYRTILLNPYIPHRPFRQQAEFLCDTSDEVFYGGSAGGGKSDALLMGALQYVEEPGYSALILRRTYPELTQEGGLIDRSHEWLEGTDAEWSESKKQWIFPSGATLQFGHMEYEKDKYRYQGSAYHFIGFDELTQFTETQYRFMFRSLRKDSDDWLPLRMRATGNPGGLGHDWVKERFIEGDKKFIPSSWRENPYLDRGAYERALDELDPVMRQYLKYGDWDYIPAKGELFDFNILESLIADFDPCEVDYRRLVRGVDFAVTGSGDRTAMTLIGAREGMEAYDILDCRVYQGTQPEQILLSVIGDDLDLYGPLGVEYVIEKEPGSSGEFTERYIKELVEAEHGPDVTLTFERPVKNKFNRARPLSRAVNNGLVRLLRGGWNDEFIRELAQFSSDESLYQYDDIVDSASLSFNTVRGRGAELSITF